MFKIYHRKTVNSTLSHFDEKTFDLSAKSNQHFWSKEFNLSYEVSAEALSHGLYVQLVLFPMGTALDKIGVDHVIEDAQWFNVKNERHISPEIFVENRGTQII